MWLGQARWVRTSQPDLKGACETLADGELSGPLLGWVKLVRQKEAEADVGLEEQGWE